MKKTKQLAIGIAGAGFVGGALLKYFHFKKIKPVVYDKYKRIGSPKILEQADVIFICTPTPYRPDKGYDDSSILQTADILKTPKIIVIKSTVIPGTTNKLQKIFPRHRFLFNPEFLREKIAFYDTAHPDRQVLGITKQSRHLALKIFQLLPKAPFTATLPASEAELVKYAGNAFLAMKVVFANQFYDLCKILNIDYEKVMQATGFDPRIGHSHFKILSDGYRGYGGTCLPKDVNTLLDFSQDKNISLDLIRVMRKINRSLLKNSGFNEEYFLKMRHRRAKSEKRKI